MNTALLTAITLQPQPASNTLGALVASAYAAGLARDDGYREGTEERQAALEAASDAAHARVRAKLAELGVDPHMLRVVLS